MATDQQKNQDVHDNNFKVLALLTGMGLATLVKNGITASATETQAAGTKLDATFNIVTTAGATDAVTLDDMQPGQIRVVKNATAVTITVFPPLGYTINGGTLNAADAVAFATNNVRVYVRDNETANIVSFIWN